MNKLYNCIFILILPLFLFPSSLNAQQVYKLALEELLTEGIVHSTEIQSSRIRLQIAEDKVSLAKNKRLPDIQIAGQLSYVGTPIILDKQFSFLKHSDAPDWRQSYTLNAVQPMYTGGRVTKNIEKSKLEFEQANLSLEKDKSNFKLWLVSKYLDLYNLYEQKKSYALSLEEAKQRLKNIEKMRHEGMITSNDVLRSQIQLTNNELLGNEVQNKILIVSQQLAIIMRVDESLVFEPDSSFLSVYTQLIPDMLELTDSAYLNYSVAKIARINTSLAKNNLKIVKSDFLPNLFLQAGNTFQRPIPNITPAQDLYLNSWGITLNLSYKLSSLFDKKHSLSSAKKQVLFQILAEEQQKQNIRINIRAAFLKHQESIKRVESLKISVDQSRENYRIMTTKYFNQLAILTDLLDANSLQLNAELQLTEAKTNVIYSYYQLLNICGKL